MDGASHMDEASRTSAFGTLRKERSEPPAPPPPWHKHRHDVGTHMMWPQSHWVADSRSMDVTAACAASLVRVSGRGAVLKMRRPTCASSSTSLTRPSEKCWATASKLGERAFFHDHTSTRMPHMAAK